MGAGQKIQRQPNQKRSVPLMLAAADLLERTRSVTQTAKLLNLTPRVLNRWNELSAADPDDPRFIVPDPLGEEETISFHKLWSEAQDTVSDFMVDVIVESARHLEPVIFEGHRSWETVPIVDVDPVDGKKTIRFEYVLDPAGDPVPLLIEKIDRGAAEFWLKSHRRGRYGDKLEVDATVKGAPIIAPAKPVDLEAFKLQFGVVEHEPTAKAK